MNARIKYSALNKMVTVDEQNSCFIPVAVETLGALGVDATDFVRLGSRCYSKVHGVPTVTSHRFNSRLSKLV